MPASSDPAAGALPGGPPAAASPVRGILLMVCGAALLTGNDAVSKFLAQTHPVGQVICLRQAATLLVIVPYVALAAGRGALRVNAWGGQIVRGLLFASTAGLMVWGLSLLPLATVTAIAFSSPIFVALLSMPMLREPVGAARWAAIVIGFAGVLIIVRPAGLAFEWALLVPLGAALANGLRDIVTRQISATESSLSVLFWSTIIVMLAAAATAPFGWAPVTADAALWFVVAGVFNAGAHFLMIESLRLGAASVVAPFRYTSLVWAVAAGYLVWGNVPDRWVLVGGLTIAASGVLMLQIERRRVRQTAGLPTGRA